MNDKPVPCDCGYSDPEVLSPEGSPSNHFQVQCPKCGLVGGEPKLNRLPAINLWAHTVVARLRRKLRESAGSSTPDHPSIH